MLNSFPFAILVGFLLGILTGLGTGGGSLLVLWLTLVLQFPPAQAKVINLLFFLPSAIIATLLLFYSVGRWNAYGDNMYYIKLNEKLKADGETLTLDENGNIKGWNDKVDGLKTQFPNMFEAVNDGSNGAHWHTDLP